MRMLPNPQFLIAESCCRKSVRLTLARRGSIHFQGRLKRFLKAGGEMISLPALEGPLTRLHPPTENGPQVAVEGIETPQGRWIVLFTTRDHPRSCH